MPALVTVGQPAALAAVRAMLGGRAPHAVLVAGPPSTGKATLACDLAAGLLCTGAKGADRPCGTCRACRMVAHRTHPDVHRLAPEGAGDQIGIGGRDRARGVRDLVTELALLPVEGVARVAIIERAHRMNEDAQSALLKTLEEPPAATTLILCADDEERLLPTVRSRCARVRMGSVATRDIERLVVDRRLADAPTAARLAHVAAGRPGLALAYAAAPDAVRIRGELVRTLLDLTAAPYSERLASARELLASAGELGTALTSGKESLDGDHRAAGGAALAAGRRRQGAPTPGDSSRGRTPADGAAATDTAEAESAPGVRVPAAERRRALALLLELWAALARDIAVAASGAGSAITDPALSDDLLPVAERIGPVPARAALERLRRASELVDANVTPELLLDVELLRWPHRPGPS